MDPIEGKIFQIIENINSLVCIGINFSSKIIGYDEIVNCQGFINSVDSNNKEEEIVSRNNDQNDFLESSVLGVQSFIRHPDQVIYLTIKIIGNYLIVLQ